MWWQETTFLYAFMYSKLDAKEKEINTREQFRYLAMFAGQEIFVAIFHFDELYCILFEA